MFNARKVDNGIYCHSLVLLPENDPKQGSCQPIVKLKVFKSN